MQSILLTTNPTEEHAPLDYSRVVELINKMSGVKYSPSTVSFIVETVGHWCERYWISPRIVMSQILHETNWFRFTGDVQWWQFNFAGLGATGKIIGNIFTVWKVIPSWFKNVNHTSLALNVRQNYTPYVASDMIDIAASVDMGVLAVVQHHAAYLYGLVHRWPAGVLGVGIVDPRYSAVLDTGRAGSIKTLHDYNGKWATDMAYAEKILPIANMLPVKGEGGSVAPQLRLVISAGHHNTSGGNPREHKLVGPLTNEYIRIGRQLGHEVISITPNDGLGEYPGDLFTAAQEVIKHHRQKPVQMFMEVHFQGLTEGSDAGRGHFIIHPDWDDDVDIDVRDTFGPDWARTFRDRVGMPIWTDGVMSEKQTGVGIQGHRLGIFRATEGIRDVTRCLIEHGSHTSPADRKIIESPGFNRLAVESFYIALHKFYALPAPNFGGTPTPPQPQKPNLPPNNVNGFWIIDEFWDECQALGAHWYSILGPPVSGAFLYPDQHGWNRKVQLFEKGGLGVYPPESPHGVPEDNIMYVRGLTWQERESALKHGLERGLVAPGTK